VANLFAINVVLGRTGAAFVELVCKEQKKKKQLQVNQPDSGARNFPALCMCLCGWMGKEDKENLENKMPP